MEPTPPTPAPQRRRRLSSGGWVLIAVLILVLGAGLYYDVLRKPSGASEEADAPAGGARSSSAARPSHEPQIVTAFPESFPKIDLADGLLEAPTPLQRPRGWGRRIVDLVPWTDGRPRLLLGVSGSYDILGGDLKRVGRLQTKDWAEHLRMLRRPHAAIRAVGNFRPPLGTKGPEYTAGIDEQGEVVWRWESGREFVKALAVLYGSAGETGVVVGVGGEHGLAALDLDGRPLWQLEKKYVVYQLHTHPELPGRLLFLGGSFELFSHGEGRDAPRTLLALSQGARDSHSSRLSPRYLGNGTLFPDAEGKASLVLAGTMLFSKEPCLLRLGEDDREAWSAKPATEIDELVLVEPPGRPRLLVATTEGGELLVLDEEGTLRARATLPETPQAGGRVATYALAAGPLGRDGWAIAVDLLGGTHLYRLHPEVLPAR